MDALELRRLVAEVLRGISTTLDGSTIRLRAVYEDPPEALQDFPCAVLWPSGVETRRGPGGTRELVWTVAWDLVGSDARARMAARQLGAFVLPLVKAFDGRITLGTPGLRVEGPVVDVGSALVWAGRTYPAQRYRLTVYERTTEAFAP